MTAKAAAKPWTEAHRREALRRTYEIAAEAAGAPRSKATAWWMVEQGDSSDHETTWRAMLGNTGMGADRINREVARVRGLAEGRLVRESSDRWEVAFADGGREGKSGDADRGQEYARLRHREHPRTSAVIHVRVTRLLRA